MDLKAKLCVAGMPIKEDMVLDSLSVTENGSYTPDEGVDGFSEVTVDVQPILTDLSVTENGTYKAEDYGAYGFNEVTTNIFTGYTIDDIVDMEWLKNKNISGDASKIRGFAFRYVDLAGAEFPNARDIGQYAFSGCKYLKRAVFPNARDIQQYAFGGCSALSYLYIPNATTIGSYAFTQVDGINSIDIGKATQIGDHAFSNAKVEKIDLQSYLGSTTTTGSATLYGAFNDCRNLKYVAFQNLINGFKQTSSSYSITNNYSFNDSSNCYFIFDMETPPTLSSKTGAFYSNAIAAKMTICVPQSALSAWQNATNWASMNIVSIESMEDELKGQFNWLDQKYWSTT